MLSKEDEALITQGEKLLEEYKKTPDKILLGKMFFIWTSMSKIESISIPFQCDGNASERILRVMNSLGNTILGNAEYIVF